MLPPVQDKASAGVKGTLIESKLKRQPEQIELNDDAMVEGN